MIQKHKKDELLNYLEDTSNLSGSAEILYIPEDVGEIPEIVREVNKKKMPLTLSAGRTGTTGGCVPQGGALLSLEKINQVKEINKDQETVCVQAGITLEGLEEKLKPEGLTLRARPTESLAFLGGAIATGASGVRGFRYGSIRDYVKRIRVILSDGFILEVVRGEIFSQGRQFSFTHEGRNFRFPLPTYTLPRVKTQAGYFVKDDMDLIDLFIGSEGTLGIIVEAEIKLQKIPKDYFDCIVFFNKEVDALSFVDAVKHLKREERFNPTSLEFFDDHSLSFLEVSYPDLPFAESAVYFEQEIEEGDSTDYVALWGKLIEEYNASLEESWFGDTEAAREKIFSFRHALPQLINETLRHSNQVKLSTDIAVSDVYFRSMYEFYKDQAQESQIRYVNFGHIGENHLHFNFLPRDEAESETAKKYIGEFIKRAVALKGTISAEHGIGKLKAPYLEMMYGSQHIQEMARLKKYFDPHLILNRDNIVSVKVANEVQ